MSDKLKRLWLILADWTEPDVPSVERVDIDALEWAIDQLRWRRVEDELPERDSVVLVRTEHRNPETAIFYGLAWNGKSDERGPAIWSVRGKVKHWRPITMPEDS